MSFFKDFKADFSQAMNELMPDSNEMYDEDEIIEEPVAEVKKPKKKEEKKPVEDSTKKVAKDKNPAKAKRPKKEVPLKTKVEQQTTDTDDLDIAPEDLSDQIDDLLNVELYGETKEKELLLDDDMEVNTLDMSVEELLSQISEKQENLKDINDEDDVQESNTEIEQDNEAIVDIDETQEAKEDSEKEDVQTSQVNDMSVDELLNQLEQAIPSEETFISDEAANIEDTTEELPNDISNMTESMAMHNSLTEQATDENMIDTSDMGLEALLDSLASNSTLLQKQETVMPELLKVDSKSRDIVTEEVMNTEVDTEPVEEEQLTKEIDAEVVTEEVDTEPMAEEQLAKVVAEEIATKEVDLEAVEDIHTKEADNNLATSADIEEQENEVVDDLVAEKPDVEEVAETLMSEVSTTEETIVDMVEEELPQENQDTIQENTSEALAMDELLNAIDKKIADTSSDEEITYKEPVEEEATIQTEEIHQNEIEINNLPEDIKMAEEKDVIAMNANEEVEAKPVEHVEERTFNVDEADTETTYITKGTKIKGDLETDGSIDIIGTVEGNITCQGKVVVGGQVTGSIVAGELYANSAKIQGDVKSYGSVKVGVGSMIIGGVEGESAVIAGAVNGDIDVKGPVIVDSTAVIMGNIKSRSVQINNGAVIEGFCSQSYSDIDVKSFFA